MSGGLDCEDNLSGMLKSYKVGEGELRSGLGCAKIIRTHGLSADNPPRGYPSEVLPAPRVTHPDLKLFAPSQIIRRLFANNPPTHK